MEFQVLNLRPLNAIAFLLLAVAGVNAAAQPEPPPLFCADDDCVETPGASQPADPGGNYTLASVGSVPFAYSTPIPPTITSEATVTPATIDANKVSGRRLILQPGNYGNQTFSTQDQEIVFTSGAEFGVLTLSSSAARLIFRGAAPRVGLTRYIQMQSNSTSDILFDGIRQDHIEVGGSNPPQDNYFYGTRVAVINSSLRTRNYAVYGAGANDLVIANNFLHSAGPAAGGTGQPQSAVRFHVTNRLVFVDNRVLNEPFEGTDQRHTFRIHSGAPGGGDTDNCYVARNQFEGPGTQITPQGSESPASGMGSIWFEDNRHYTTGYLNLMNWYNPGSYPQRLILRNNIAYGSLPNNWPPQYTPDWIVENNTVESSRPAPAWDFR